MADYGSIIQGVVGLASMAASALAKKHHDKQQQDDTRYDIQMENAMRLGAPGAQYQKQWHDMKLDQRRTPVDYGQGLNMLGHGIAGAFSNGKGADASANESTLANDPVYQAPGLPSHLDTSLQLPHDNGPMYPQGSSPSIQYVPDQPGGGSSSQQLSAPDWQSLKLDDEDNW